MNKIIEFFKKLFKINTPKMIEAPKEIAYNNSYQSFINSIKVPENMHAHRVK